MLKINETILGAESRSCEIDDCNWSDASQSYGVYIQGKYYCPKHGKEFGFVDGEWVRINQITT